jgi:hypothetical protein
MSLPQESGEAYKTTNKLTMSIFSQDDMTKRMAHALRLQQDGVCLTWIKHREDYCWLNAKETQTQIRQFKKLLQKGAIEVSSGNNKTFTYKGKKWFSLVILPTDENDQSFCPSMLLIFGYMVSGYGYMFSNKQNRDKMYEWLVGAKKAKAKAKEVVPDPPAVKARRRKRKRCEANDPPAEPPTYNGVFDYPTNDPVEQ